MCRASACDAAGPATHGGPIALSLVASRVSGVAPLTVFFDATGTTAAGTPRPFHDLEYRWDFGDAGKGRWSTGSTTGDRNLATGPVAAHVFETPGTYTVNLTANAAKSSRVITVQDPDMVFSGTVVKLGEMTAVVTATGINTLAHSVT